MRANGLCPVDFLAVHYGGYDAGLYDLLYVVIQEIAVARGAVGLKGVIPSWKRGLRQVVATGVVSSIAMEKPTPFRASSDARPSEAGGCSLARSPPAT
jgi:hypothetical protein